LLILLFTSAGKQQAGQRKGENGSENAGRFHSGIHHAILDAAEGKVVREFAPVPQPIIIGQERFFG
jgi:hypothetical protein